MKKIKFFIPLLLGGLVLAGCEDASELKDVFSNEDLVINTPWEEFSMPAIGVEFADGEESIELNKGEQHTFTYELVPKGATSNTLKWESEDENVATVSDGVVTATGGGQTNIKVSGKSIKINSPSLSVKVNVPLTDFSVDVPEKLDWDEKYTLTPTFEPGDTTYTDLKYEIVSSSCEGLVSVDETGEISTGSADGTATLKVTSEYLGEEKAKEYEIKVETIPVSSITLSSKDDIHEVEINKTLSLKAEVSPENASDFVKKGIKYYSRDPEIATVDEVTGVISGVKVSDTPARIYAKVGSKESEDFNVTVYRVLATSVAFTNEPIALSNSGVTPHTEEQLAWTISTDRAEMEPSNVSISFASENEEVATVNESGLVKAIGPGNTNVSIVLKQDGVEDVVASIPVSVSIVSTSVKISGKSIMYSDDEPITLTAALTPANVTDPTITWTLSDETLAELDVTTGSSVHLSPKDVYSVGEVNVTATNGSISDTHKVTIVDKTEDFIPGEHYIVGNHIYKSGSSVAHEGISSWDNAKHAYHFVTENVNNESFIEYKGTIHFVEGDEFRYRIGNDWIKGWEQYEESRGYHIEDAGAFKDGSMHYVEAENPESNIYVDQNGWYDLYAKTFKDTGWEQLHIKKVPDISVDVSDLAMGIDDVYEIAEHLHDYIGEVSYEVSDDSIISVTDSGLLTALAEGTATVTITDERSSEVIIHVEVDDGISGISRIVYLNANGKMNTGYPYVHSWIKADNTKNGDTKMSKVTGQDIVYEAAIPVEHDMVVFVDCKSEAATIDWTNNVYSQTADLELGEKDMFTPKSKDGEGKYTGEWDVFDSSKPYNPELDPPYIKYEKAGGWAFAQLVEDPGNTAQYKYENLEFEAGTEFVIRAGNDDWRHYDNFNATYSTDKVVQGTTDTQNFKASVAGTYNFYVKKNASDDEGKNVFITCTPTVSTYTVSFNGNGGTGEMANVPDQSGSYTLPANGFSAPSGKAFAGWKANNTGETIAVGASYDLSADVTFYAQWSDVYTVSFNSNGGSGSMASVTAAGSYTLPSSTFTAPTGKTFAGWKANNTGDAIEAGGSYSVSANVTFYAQWSDSYVANNVTVYLSASWDGWESPKAYVFDVDNENASKTEWPGEPMSYVGVNDLNQTVFSYTVDINTYDYIVFTNGGEGNNNKTVNIDISSATTGKAYYLDEIDSGTGKIAVGEWTYSESELTSKQIVYFTNNKGWENPHFHIFKGTTSKSEWPGDTAKWVFKNSGNEDVYRVLIDTSLYDSLIFNGSGGQTVDIALSSLSGDNNAYYLLDATDGSGNYLVGQWQHNPFPSE